MVRKKRRNSRKRREEEEEQEEEGTNPQTKKVTLHKLTLILKQ